MILQKKQKFFMITKKRIATYAGEVIKNILLVVFKVCIIKN